MEQGIVITRSQLRQAIEDYIAASRVGETLSYVETAKLSTADAAESSTSRLWSSLEAQATEDVACEPEAPPAATGVVLPGTEFTCAEDLAAGQVVFVNSRGLIEGKRNADESPQLADKPVATIEFDFFQAEHLLGLFGGDTDAKFTVETMPDKRVLAHASDYPEEGYVELIDTPGVEPEPPTPEDNDSLFA